MKIRFQELIIFLSLLSFSIFTAHGQVNTCALKLIEAREQFNAGQIESVPRLLLDCIDRGFSKEDKIEAYKLLINAYIFDNNLDRADILILGFMKEFPEYKVSPDDQFEFVSLLEEYDNSPRYSMGFNFGTNVSILGISEPYGVTDPASETAAFKPAPGFKLGGNLNINLTKRFGLSVDPMFSISRMKYEYSPFPFTSTLNKESHSRIDLPLSFIYSFNDKVLSPYARIGFMTSYLLSAKSELTRTHNNTGEVNFEEITGQNEDISSARNPLHFWAFAGAGVRYNLPSAYMFAEVRYNAGLSQMVDPESRRDPNDDKVWLFYYMQDDFFINDLSLIFGYSRNFYNPKRKY